jgi:hypothetical protein
MRACPDLGRLDPATVYLGLSDTDVTDDLRHLPGSTG